VNALEKHDDAQLAAVERTMQFVPTKTRKIAIVLTVYATVRNNMVPSPIKNEKVQRRIR